MSTLADQFLNDFNDFNDEEIKNQNNRKQTTTTTTTTTTNNNVNSFDKDNILLNGGTNNHDLMNIDKKQEEENDHIGDKEDLMLSDEQIEQKQQELIQKHKDSTIDVIAKLNSTLRLNGLISKVEKQLNEKLPERKIGGKDSNNSELDLIIDCNVIVQDIQHEIYLIHKYLLEKYSKKFPELSRSVQNPLDYINVVKRLGNSLDLKDVQLNDLLPRSTIMVLMVTLSSTTGKPLSEENLAMVMTACDMGLELERKKRLILSYLESRMSFIAPNLTILVGSTIASKLIGIAGSVKKLSIIPAGNLQYLGADRRSLGGFSSVTFKTHQTGLISQCDIIKNVPQDLKEKTLRALLGRVSLATRIDASQETALNGEIGQQYKDEILHKVEKLQEPPPSKKEKPLPAPIDKVKKRRGGEKARKKKALYASTDLRKAQNRMAFNVEEESFGDSGMNMGMIGGQTGKVRLTAQDRGILKKKKLEHHGGSGTKSVYTGGTQTYVSGLQSVAMTPSQGLSLSITSTDILAQNQNKTSKYFNKDGGITKKL